MEIIWNISVPPHGGKPIGELAEQVIAAYKILSGDLKPKQIMVDVIGVGPALFTYLSDKGMPVEIYNPTWQTK